MITTEELEEALAARIEALPSDDWAQGMSPAETWTESDIPLTAVQDSTLQQHLAFSVSVEAAPVVDDGNASEGFLSVLPTVVVMFTYRLRSDRQRADLRTAQRAARQLVGAMMQPSNRWGSPLPLNIYTPGLPSEFLAVEQRYTFQIDVPIPALGGIS